MSAVRIAETRAETLPETERDMQDDEVERPECKEQLYVDVLYTIANAVGAPAPGGQVNLYSVNNKMRNIHSCILCMARMAAPTTETEKKEDANMKYRRTHQECANTEKHATEWK